ncbi:glycosyl hydrolase family 5 [Methylacidiphilum kamchatkense Kam1]|uniref:Glycosyl hydrolase family 5 n=2 Tax=Methylacidiphilum kamchatkense Kam1 TaxID=1202785 RepID=A0ABR4ZWB9_9BACT|nr:M20/M25/M40 family metallo-hydrolase [Methylacidiphilum kamchatkense]KIE57998.1 glycosyl hydrolase family 5 [Methylacidiphilum kamchatkense Kam1]
MTLEEIAKRIFSLPTAPLHEKFIAKEIYSILSEYPQSKIEIDPFSNLLVQLDFVSDDKDKPLLLFVAHMDHPGFYSDSQSHVYLLGGVNESYLEGAKLIFFSQDHGEKVGESVIKGHQNKGKFKMIQCEPTAPPNSIGMWDLPPFFSQDGIFYGRSCDDLVGVCSLLYMFIQIVSKNLKTKIAILFSRAEEIGFLGTLAFLKKQILNPENTIMISIEASMAQGYGSMNEGPVLRVGDKTRLFDASVVSWLEKALEDYRKVHPEFVYQKKFMGGGTCETTPFIEFGYRSAALCLAMDNYHNMAIGNQIAMESVSIKDWEFLCSFLLWLASYPRELNAIGWQRKERLLDLQEKAIDLLKQFPLF